MSSLSPPPRCAARRDLQVRHRRKRLAQRLEVARLHVLDELVGGAGRHAQGALDLGGRLALIERLGDGDGVPQAADHVVDQARDALTLLAQLEQQLDRGLLVAGDQRVGERPDLLLGRGGAGLDDLLGADRGARAVLEGELLELAQEPLLAVADLRDERLRAVAVQVDLQRLGLAFQPLRQIPRLDVVLGRDLAADLLDRLVELVRGLVAALLAGEERDRERLGVGGLQRLDDGLDLRVLPALHAVRDHEPAAHGERHRAQRDLHRRGRALVALVDLDARGAGLVLGHRAQAGAPLGDATVVVAVDEVSGAEGGHGE